MAALAAMQLTSKEVASIKEDLAEFANSILTMQLRGERTVRHEPLTQNPRG